MITKEDDDMLNDFGKICRKIRIDKGEIMADMSKKLRVSTAFLSAVEHGKKPVPIDWVDTIINIYDLEPTTAHELEVAAKESLRQVNIVVEDLGSNQKDFVLAFARNFNNVNQDDINKIMKLLKG